MAEVKKNIVLVDDHVIVRNGLKELIEKLGSFRISQEFDNGEALLNALPLQADLIIMDLSMPGRTGDVVMELLGKEQPGIPVLILTLSEEEQTIIRLFRLGVRGYLKKNCTAAVMREAITEIFEKGYYQNEFLLYSLRNDEDQGRKTLADLLLERLSAREKEFLKLLVHEKEYTYMQIADLMSVQPRTVDGYRESIFDKFSVRSKTGLVLFMVRNGLLEKL